MNSPDQPYERPTLPAPAPTQTETDDQPHRPSSDPDSPTLPPPAFPEPASGYFKAS